MENMHIVHAQAAVYTLQHLCKIFQQGVKLRIPHQFRIHMHDGMNIQLLLNGMLQMAGNSMSLQKLHSRSHLNMQRSKDIPRPVAMGHHIMHPQHPSVPDRNLHNPAQDFRVCRLAQNRLQCLAGSPPAAVHDEHAHHYSGRAIKVIACPPINQQAGNNHGGSHAVAHAVHSHRIKGRRIRLFAKIPVKCPQPHLQHHREHHNSQGRCRNLHRFRCQQLLNGSLEQFKSHQEDYPGNNQGGNILDAPVAIGVLLVRRLGRHLQPQHSHNGTSRIGKIVDAVANNPHRTTDKARHQLHGTEQQIHADAHTAA